MYFTTPVWYNRFMKNGYEDVPLRLLREACALRGIQSYGSAKTLRSRLESLDAHEAIELVCKGYDR